MLLTLGFLDNAAQTPFAGFRELNSHAGTRREE
jgi:hypothetical protein